MSYARCLHGTCLAVLLLVIGCGKEEGSESGQPSSAGAQFLLAEEPAGAVSVIAARKQIKKEDAETELVIVGQISPEPWSKTHAIFTIADPSLATHKHDDGEECHFCAKSKLASGVAVVKIVAANDEVVKTDARKLLGLSESQVVVARGRAKYDDLGNLVVRATGIFIRN
ncbi:MAG: hypothetical protein IH991_18820 [Planctomycetes bacterium]|nr:hypothetical protein [Planctomycetota bacterium]